MRAGFEKLWRALGWCAALLAALPAAGLWAASLGSSAAFDPSTFLEKLTVVSHSRLLTLGGSLLLAAALGAAALCGGVGRRVRQMPCHTERASSRPARLLCRPAVWAALGTAALGAVYGLSLHSHPVNDQAEVWSLAVALAAGEFGPVNWDYFTMYPYQAGMALCLEPLVRLFGADPYPAFALCNALCAGACAAAAAVLAGLLQKGADRVCGLLCLLFFPLALSSSFLYGTMAGTACALWAVCGAVQLCRGGSRRWWLAVALLLPAVVLYSGMQVFALAVCLVLGLDALRGRDRLPRLAAAAVLLAVCLSGPSLAQAAFSARTGVVLGQGIPKSAWVYMGLTAAETNSAAGGYNSYPKQVFWANGADPAAANAAVMADLRGWLAEFAADPAAKLPFFREKLLTEWLDPWFTSLTVTYQPETDVPGAFAALWCGGPLLAPATALLRVLCSFVYGAAAAGSVLTARRHKGAVWAALPGICFLGGFLFQIVWENHARYCMPYFLCLLPLAAEAVCTAVSAPARKGENRGPDC